MADIIFTISAAALTRYAVFVGKVKDLKDNQVPPQPRNALPAEVKQFMGELIRAPLINYDQKIAVDAAVSSANASVPSFDWT